MKIPDLINNYKEQFGTYAVMALMNAQTVLDHIQKLACIGNSESYKEDLWKHPVMLHIKNAAYETDNNPETTLFVMEKLQFYFPFLKIMAERQREYSNKKYNENRLAVNSRDLFFVLDKVFRVLKNYRNTTAHFMTKSLSENEEYLFLKNEQPLANMVNEYYTVALRDMKDRYSYSTEDLAFIQDNRYKQTRGDDGKRKATVNLDFFLSLQSHNGDPAKKLHLSGVGVALLICLFLEKQYVNLFISKLSIFSTYKPNSEQHRIICRSMGIHSIKLPKDRIHSLKDGMSVAMDMLNETKRCPKELFDTLSADKQARFRTISDDHNEVLLMRSSDRFAQLLLQYIDYNKLFKGIRFHVNMGKLRYLFNAAKNCIDGQTRVRVIEHQLNGYGRIDEIEAERKSEDGKFANSGISIRDFENVRRDDGNPENYPYVVDTYSHYILENNKVEMQFTDSCILPFIEEYGGKWYVAKDVPACRISTLELPALAFHMLLLGSKKTEERIKEVYGKYMKLFEAMSNDAVTKENIESFGIALWNLPQKAIDAINGCAHAKNVNAFIKNTVEEMLADTEKRLERLKEDRKGISSHDNKMGKPNFRQISTGRLADFLAKDIVKLQPATTEDGSDKMTGLNYRVMQAAIATYNSNGNPEAEQQFRGMFEKARLIGKSPNAHPFLYKVFASALPKNTIEFYDKYLRERKRYLSNLTKDIESGKTASVPFVNRNQNKWKKPNQEYLGQTYGNSQNLAIELPRQMFDADIKAFLKGLPEMKDVDFDNANVTFLIGEYMKRVLADDFQNFYAWKRNYRYMDMLMGETDSKDGLRHMFTSVEEREKLWREREGRTSSYRKWAARKNQGCGYSKRLPDNVLDEILAKRLSGSRNDYQKCEKAIRRQKVQDAMLFMLAKKAFTQHADFEGKDFKLKNIMPDADKGILSETMPMTFTFEKGGKQYTIESGGMKLKNYGDFHALANDRRIGCLMKLIGTNTAQKEDLISEFNKYDQCRPQVVKLVLDLEKWAFAKYPELGASEEMSYVSFDKILNKLTQHRNLGNRQSNILRKIRNAFDHNSYPESGIVEITTLPEIAQNMKDMFGRYAIVK